MGSLALWDLGLSYPDRLGGSMRVGDLVIQRGWEADGAGLVIEVHDSFAAVLWPDGEVNMAMAFDMLEVISASR